VDAHTQYLLVDGTRDMTGILNMGGFKITNGADPILAQDFATKNYVDINEKDENVKISSNDTTPDFLVTKLVAGTNITLTEQNDAGNETLKIDSSIGGSGGFGFEVMEFGDSSSGVKDKFLKSAGTNHTSLDSAPLGLGAGEIIHVSISTEKDATNNWFVQIIKNAIKGAGSPPFQGGTQVGTDLEKPTAQLDKFHRNLTGFTIAADDRIAVFVKQGTLGGKSAVEPLVRLYVKYD